MVEKNANNNYGRITFNNTFLKDDEESIFLQGLQITYTDVQFIVVVNGKFEKILKYNTEGENIFFQTESLRITPDYNKPATNIKVKNISQKDISYTLNILPWSDPYLKEFIKVKEDLEFLSRNILTKTFPIAEFVPTNTATTFVHNLSKEVSELSVKVIDFTNDTYLQRPIFGKFIDDVFKCGDILFKANIGNPRNSIDVEFKGAVRPKYCSLRLEGRSLTLEILDSPFKNYTSTNKNIPQGESETLKHDLDLDLSLLPVSLKIEYTVDGRIVAVPGNRPKIVRFVSAAGNTFVNLFAEGHLAGEGNFILSLDKASPKNSITFTNNIDLHENSFKQVGYTIEISPSAVILTAHIELVPSR
jgi:hypothetical protein